MINEFSSVFEIMTLLNLGYAGSKTFRSIIDSSILKLQFTISQDIQNKIDQLTSEIIVFGEQTTDKVKDDCQKLKGSFEKETYKIRVQERLMRRFPDGIKSIFLITTLYCFTLLLIGGYEQFYTDSINKINELLAFINLTIIILLARNCFAPSHKSNARPFYTFLLFLLPFIIFIICEKLEFYFFEAFIPSQRMNLAIAFFISCSAFILHILRSFGHRLYFRIRVYSESDKTDIVLNNKQIGGAMLGSQKGKIKVKKLKTNTLSSSYRILSNAITGGKKKS